MTRRTVLDRGAPTPGPTGPRPQTPTPTSHGETTVSRAVDAVVDAVKPRLRGWLHAGAFPLVVLAGLALVVYAPTLRMRVGAAVFALTAGMLFGTSAVYHRGTWRPGAQRLLRRLDHMNIFLIIAGTYTVFALTLLPDARTLLVIMWVGAIAGVLQGLFATDAPRWVTTPIYIALGWVAVFYIKPFYLYGGPWVLALIVAGGVLYTLGAVVYATRRPDPSPRWFGFHEIFHLFTILAFTAHYIAAVYAIAHA